MSISKNKFAAPVIVLSSICLVVSLALAFTYKIANPIISCQKRGPARCGRFHAG